MAERRRLAGEARDEAGDEGVDVLAQVQAEAAATWRSPSDSKPTVRGGERLRAWCEGYSLHAGVVIAEHDRAALERLCRYGARPAFAHERLAWTAEGQIVYRLKRPWPDGRTHLVLPPVAFLRRLCGTIPPPRRHLVRYAGVFGPAYRQRANSARWCRRPPPSPPACRRRAALTGAAGFRGPRCCAECSPPTCLRARAAAGAAWSPSSSTLPPRAPCSRRSACR
jgi:hypothetical protein